MKEKLTEIIQHYGIDNQLRKFTEEYFELIEAIINYKYVELHKGSPAEKYHKKCVAEEIADCLNLLSQFANYYEIEEEEIYAIAEYKVDRQLDRMKEEK